MDKLNVFEREALIEDVIKKHLLLMLKTQGADKKVIRFFEQLMENGVSPRLLIDTLIKTGLEELGDHGD